MRALLKRIEEAEGPNFALEAAIQDAFSEWENLGGFWRQHKVTGERQRYTYASPPAYTASTDAALSLVDRLLPDFWVTSGLCSLTGHASIGPDYNGPHGDRLRETWPEEQFHDGFNADLAPGDGRHRQCFAILHCVIQAMIARVSPCPFLGGE